MMPKKILYGRFYNGRMRGRARNRWKDAVRKNHQTIIGVRVWRIKSDYREEWMGGWEED